MTSGSMTCFRPTACTTWKSALEGCKSLDSGSNSDFDRHGACLTLHQRHKQACSQHTMLLAQQHQQDSQAVTHTKDMYEQLCYRSGIVLAVCLKVDGPSKSSKQMGETPMYLGITQEQAMTQEKLMVEPTFRSSNSSTSLCVDILSVCIRYLLAIG